MMNYFLTIAKSLGLSSQSIKIGVYICLSATFAHYVTKLWQKNETESEQLQNLTAAVNTLSINMENILKGYNDKLECINSRMENSESAIISLSVFNEKASTESITFLSNYIYQNQTNSYMFKRTINRIEELQLDHLPTKNNFIEKVNELKEK